jgi:hypothetical protein
LRWKQHLAAPVGWSDIGADPMRPVIHSQSGNHNGGMLAVTAGLSIYRRVSVAEEHVLSICWSLGRSGSPHYHQFEIEPGPGGIGHQ